MCCFFEIAIADVVEAAKDADILVFVLPHQFMDGICQKLAGHVKPTAIGISLIKVAESFVFLLQINDWCGC